MDRLTFEGLFCDIAQCRETPGGSYCEDGMCSQRETWERLKAYEDTGLTPEQCKELAAADVEPVRHGRWLDVLETDLYVPDHGITITKTAETCSECKARIGFIGAKQYLFDAVCPNCSARMDEGADNG